MHQVSLIRRSGAAKTVQGAGICPVAFWALSGGFRARPNAKQVRRNGFDQQVLAGAAFQS